MSRKPKTPPSFFKVLVKDFTRKLCLPPFFSQKWGNFLPENAKLRNSCGETWDVKLEKESNEKFYFTGGWTKFTEDLGLKMGEFLVFRFTGNHTFDVTVYGISGCEREMIPAKDSNPDACGSGGGITGNIKAEVDSDHEDVTDPKDGFQAMSFSKEMKRYHMYSMYIPRSFALATGIARKKSINLQDSKCRNWPVEIKAREDNMNSVSMDAGWTEFLVGNKVVLGSTILFEYVTGSDNSVKATVIENGKTGKEFFRSPKKGRGWPKSAETSDDCNCNGAKITDNIEVEANSDHGDVTDPKDGSVVTSFSKELTNNEIYRLEIPKSFALATGIVGKKILNLQDSKCRNWPVEIKARSDDMNSILMTDGWNNFLVGNKVFLGSTILFEYVTASGNSIKATVIENKTNGTNGKEFVWSTKRGRGRPKTVGTSEDCVFF